MMKTVKMKAANPIGGVYPEHVQIEISGSISDDTKPIKDLKYIEKYFDQEAEKLFQALINALPQGVIEPLTIKLLQCRVSLYHRIMK